MSAILPITRSFFRPERIIWPNKLADAVFFYIGDELEWDVELAIPSGVIEPVKLGKSGRLGWTPGCRRTGPQGTLTATMPALARPTDAAATRGLMDADPSSLKIYCNL